MDLTGIIFMELAFGITIILCALLLFSPYIKDKHDVRKKNYKVYKVIRKEQVKAPEHMDVMGREDTYYGYTLEDEQGQQVYFESIWNFYKEGNIYKLKKVGNEYETVGRMGHPGVLPYVVLFIGIVVTGLGVITLLRKHLNISDVILVKICTMSCVAFPAFIVGLMSFIDNCKTCQKKNLVTAKVASYEWKDYYSQSSNSEEAIEHVLVLYISYVKDGRMYTEPVQKVAENGLIKRKYPVGSDIKVYINPDGDYAVQNGTNNNIILKNRRFRGYLLGIFLMTAAIAITLIILFVYKGV